MVSNQIQFWTQTCQDGLEYCQMGPKKKWVTQGLDTPTGQSVPHLTASICYRSETLVPEWMIPVLGFWAIHDHPDTSGSAIINLLGSLTALEGKRVEGGHLCEDDVLNWFSKLLCCNLLAILFLDSTGRHGLGRVELRNHRIINKVLADLGARLALWGYFSMSKKPDANMAAVCMHVFMQPTDACRHLCAVDAPYCTLDPCLLALCCFPLQPCLRLKHATTCDLHCVGNVCFAAVSDQDEQNDGEGGGKSWGGGSNHRVLGGWDSGQTACLQAALIFFGEALLPCA